MPAAKFKLEKTCEVCGKTFLAKTIYSKYCSDRCSQTAYRRKKRDEKMEQLRKEKIATIPDERIYISIPEAVAMFGVGRDTLYRLIRKGKLPAVNLGERLIRISRAHIESMFSKIDVQQPQVKKSIAVEPSFNPEDCYTIGEITEKFGISASTVDKTIRKNSIPKRQIGKYVYVPKSEIDKLFK